MSTYLYSKDREQLTYSTSLSRLILALVSPFANEANMAFRAEAQTPRDVEMTRLLAEGESPGFGGFDIDDPLDGWEGVRGMAFVLADAALPQDLTDALIAQLFGQGKDPDEIREHFAQARQFIAKHALSADDVLVM